MSVASLAWSSVNGDASQSLSARPSFAAASLVPGRAAWLWSLLLFGLFAFAQPVRAQTFITTDTTINYTINGDVFVQGAPTVALVSGGSIAANLLTYNTSTVTVSGGSIGGLIATLDSSTVNVSGGSIGGIQENFSSTVNLSGGSVRGNLLLASSGATLNVYGANLSLSTPSTNTNGFTYYTLTGTLQDGTPINNSIYVDNGAVISQVHLFNTDPFPSLKTQVQALADNGTLNKGNTNALLVKLNAAQTAAAAGDVAGERDALTAFVNQVNAFVHAGKLTSAQAQALTTAAQAILNSLP